MGTTRDFGNGRSWRKSSRSERVNNCVFLPGDLDAVRDSKDGDRGPVLHLSREAVAALVRTVAA
jgi:hypothetical protein